MSHTAQQFIGPLTLQTLTRRRPMTDPLELLPDQRIAHIVAADTADLILVAPATARWLAAMAAGLAGRRHHRHMPRLDGARRRGAGDGRRHVRASGDARERRDSSRSGATRSSSRRSARSRRAPSARAGWRSPRAILDAVSRALEGKPIRQPDAALPAAGRRRGADPGSGGLARRGDRRRHRRADRSGALHRQPLNRQDGRRASPRPRSTAARK